MKGKGNVMKHAFVYGLLSLVFITVGCKIPDIYGSNRPIVVGIAELCRSEENVTCKTTYSRAIYAAGGIPFVLPATTNSEEVARILGKVDVLVLCGGEDVAPARYKTAPAPKLEAVNLKRDAWEYALLDEAVRRRLPVVGTCRGMQIINVYFGGTLWQDLPSERKSEVKHRHTGDGKYVTHPIAMVPGSRISALFDGATNAVVNSRHHQAVKDLAPGLRITARAADGVVEAIESETLPIAAVQFHPEVHFAKGGQREFLVFFRRILDWAGSR